MDVEHPLKSGYGPDNEAHKQLQREVEDVITWHKNSIEMPPFAAGELIVIALICSSGTTAGKAMTDEDILRWIVTSFKFYNARMHDECSKRLHHLKVTSASRWSQLESSAGDDETANAEYPSIMSAVFRELLSVEGRADDEDLEGEADMALVVKGFFIAFHQDEVPLTENTPDQPPNPGDSPSPSRWYITNSQARMFLRKWLEPERKGRFDFFGLPAELRNRIYEDVLLYPLPGVQISSRSPPFVLKHIPNASTENLTWQATYRSPNLKWAAITTPNRTAFFRVCQQTFKEATPIYYGLNSFSFRQFRELALALQKLSPERVRQLKSLHIQMPVSHGRSMPKEKLEHLQLDTLTVGVWEGGLESGPAAFANYHCLLVIAARTKTVKFYYDGWDGYDEDGESDEDESDEDESAEDESDEGESAEDDESENEDDEDDESEDDESEGEGEGESENENEGSESEGDSSEADNERQVCKAFEAWFIDALETHKKQTVSIAGTTAK